MANGGKIVAYATFLQYLQQNIDHPDLAERSIDGNLGNLDVDYDTQIQPSICLTNTPGKGHTLGDD